MSSNIQIQRICQHCSNEFTARTTVTQFCSDRCSKRAYKARIKSAKIESSNKETQLIISKPIEEIKSKAFLSISETCKLIGISRRTLYRMIERKELVIGKAGKRTIIRRSDLEQLLFGQYPNVTFQPSKKIEQRQINIADCYNLTEVQNKYCISETALQNIIKRNGITKVKRGRYAYVPMADIDKLLK